MSGGPRLQDPIPLTINPFRITLREAASITAAAKKNRASANAKKRIQEDAQKPSPYFLSAAVPYKSQNTKDQEDICTVTVQSCGIYIYNLSDQHCIHSFSISPSISLASPAVFVPSITSSKPSSSLKPDDSMDIDNEEPEESTDSPQKYNISGKVCVAISVGADGSTSKRQIWIWDVEQSRQVYVPGKPSRTVTLDSAIHSIGASSDGNLVVVFSDGEIGILNLDKLKLSQRLKAPSAKPCTVLWSRILMVAGAMRVVLVLKESGDDAKFFVQKVVVDMENPSGKASQRLELELPKTPLSFPFSPSPISFTYSVDTQELHVLDQSGDLCIFPTSSILNGQITPRISIDISQVKLALNSSLFSGLYGSSCLAPIESSYVAIVGPRYRGKYIEEVLTLWDIKYGTLQAERILNTKDPELASTDVLSTIESKASNGRVFDIRVTTSTALGPTLVVSISDIEEVQPITFSSFTHLIPYYSTEITLLSALGKMQGTAFSVDNINDAELKISKDSKGLVSIANINGDDEPHLWLSNLLDMEKFDRDTIMNLLNPTATKTAADFEAALLQWLVKKTSNDATSFATLPFVEIAQPVMQAFLLRILAKPSAFWPSQALRYLIRTGRATAHVDPLNRESASSNLIRAVLDRDDLETLAAVLEPGMVPDLSEMDLVSILKYVCATQADGEAKSALQLQRRVVAMDKAVKAMMPKPAKDPKSKSTVEEVVVGRNWYFEKIFTMPKNDIHMSRAMKVLRVEDLEILVEWAKSLVVKDERETLYHLNKKAEVEELQREERKPLWWLWPAENAHALHYDMALDVLTLIIDSNLSAVLLSASLQERFEGLAEVLNVDMKVMSLLERRLKESLVPFNAPPKKQKKKVEGADKEDQHRQRWKRMVADVHDGVGKYSMEVFKI